MVLSIKIYFTSYNYVLHQDTQWNDIDYMSKWFDWTHDEEKFKDLPEVVQDLHDHGQHYIMIVVSMSLS